MKKDQISCFRGVVCQRLSRTGHRYACCQICFILLLLLIRTPNGVDLPPQPIVFFVVAQYARKIIAHGCNT